ncbi:MAG: endonuclease III [Candidatus Kariarchaeaceae archaeon]
MDVESVIRILKETHPDSKISLDFRNIFELLVATMLSAQSTDQMVNKATPSLFAAYPDPQTMADATAEDIVPYIKSIGLYNTKSKSLVKMAKLLVEEHNGTVPASMKALTALPGVGRKTANVVMGNGFKIGDTGITVDTHVTRIANRIGWTTEKSAIKIEKDLMRIIPEEDWVDITHLLISHGRTICPARHPQCKSCPISSHCESAFSFQ